MRQPLFGLAGRTGLTRPRGPARLSEPAPMAASMPVSRPRWKSGAATSCPKDTGGMELHTRSTEANRFDWHARLGRSGHKERTPWHQEPTTISMAGSWCEILDFRTALTWRRSSGGDASPRSQVHFACFPHPNQSASGALRAGEPCVPAHRGSMRSIRRLGSIKNRATSWPWPWRFGSLPRPRSRGRSRRRPGARR
jgi:hypothetical protein